MSRDKEPVQSVQSWLAFVTSLPTGDPSSRMRILRTLESLGCGVLREGVYLLPDTAANRRSLARLSDYVNRAGGSSDVLSVTADGQAQEAAFRALFDRSAKYEELAKAVEGLRAGFGISEPSAIARVLNKQRRDFDAIAAHDFFPSRSRERATRVLQETEAQVRGLLFPDRPHAEVAVRSARSYFKRSWATRRPLWADRLASAWLIRRFIDPEATMLWLDKNQDCPEQAVGYAFEGAAFANSRERVTFEQLLAGFGLERNATLARIGALVHCLDLGGAPVAEAAGVETLLQGARRRSASEDELLLESEKTFDLLYEAYFDPGKP